MSEAVDEDQCIYYDDAWRRCECAYHPGELTIREDPSVLDEIDDVYLHPVHQRVLDDPLEKEIIKLDLLCAYDWAERFVEFVHKHRSWVLADTYNSKNVWQYIFDYDSVNCATAILDGKTKGIVDWPSDGCFHTYGGPSRTPLTEASFWGSPKVVKLFLSRGVGPGINSKDSNNHLPLNAALDLVLHAWHMPGSGFFGLVVKLCGDEIERYRLETIRFLVQHMAEVDVQQEFIKYATEGKFKEVAALLAVAREKIISHSSNKVLRHLLKEAASLVVRDAIARLLFQSNEWSEQRKLMQEVLVLISLFQRIGDKLSLLLRQEIPLDQPAKDGVKALLTEAGCSAECLLDFQKEYSYSSMSELLEDQSVFVPIPQLKGYLDLLDIPKGSEELPNSKLPAAYYLPINRDAQEPLTLELALEAIGHHRHFEDWNPKKSIFKLVYILCTWDLTKPLATVELLAKDAPGDDVLALWLRCIQQGKLVEMAALLMVAWDKVLKLDADGKPTTHQGVLVEKIESVLLSELQLMGSEYTLFRGKYKLEKGALLFASTLLKIFESARGNLNFFRKSRYLKVIRSHEVPYHVSQLLKDWRFSLSTDDVDFDDIKCFRRKSEVTSFDHLGGVNEVIQSVPDSIFLTKSMNENRSSQRSNMHPESRFTLQRYLHTQPSPGTCDDDLANNVVVKFVDRQRPSSLSFAKGCGILGLASNRCLRGLVTRLR